MNLSKYKQPKAFTFFVTPLHYNYVQIFKEEIEKKFSMKVFVGDPWARTVYQDGLRQILDGLGPRMAVSIGLAMRNIVK